MAGAVSIYRLHVAIELITPAIWREIEVPSNMTLSSLHGVMQALMGWHDAHLWAFESNDQRFVPADPESSAPLQPAIDPDRVTLGTLLAGRGDGLRYNYDFGDDWWLKIKVVSVGDLESKERYPAALPASAQGHRRTAVARPDSRNCWWPAIIPGASMRGVCWRGPALTGIRHGSTRY